MHRLLDRQVMEATGPDGEFDLTKFLAAVDKTYARAEDERRGIVRSMQLMSEEATALTREVKESTGSQLQAVLDHVKDVIMTVDEEGHIASLNMTGQRVFGHTESEAIGRPLGFLLPRLAGDQPICGVLDVLAARLEDTQVDLAAHETLGQHANGSLFAAEISVSKTTLNILGGLDRPTTGGRQPTSWRIRSSSCTWRSKVKYSLRLRFWLST